MSRMHQHFQDRMDQANLSSARQSEEMRTGSRKFVMNETPELITASQKSSYHNPVSGVSEKYAIQTREEKIKSSSDEQRKRDDSNERKMRNLAYQDQLDSHYHAHHPTVEQPHIQRVPMGNIGNTLRQPTHSQLGPHQYSRKSGKYETKGDRVITEQKLYFFDPFTGKQENKTIRTEIKDPNLNEGIKKQTYDHRIIETPNGPEEEIKVTHREGSVLENLKNKLTNLMNHGF